MGKPSWFSIGAWVGLIGIVIYLVYVATHTATDTENYKGGKAENNYNLTQNKYPLAFPDVMCGPFFKIDGSAPVKTTTRTEKK